MGGLDGGGGRGGGVVGPNFKFPKFLMAMSSVDRSCHLILAMHVPCRIKEISMSHIIAKSPCRMSNLINAYVRL